MSQARTASFSGSGLHTILGAGGVVARELSLQLARDGLRVRQVSRRPVAVKAGDEWQAADLTDARATDDAVAGSEVVYLVAGLLYSAAAWQAQWPRVMRNALDACARHGARLVFFDNVYAYGQVDGAMTETTPFNPCSRKGEVRATIATTLLDAVRQGDLQALIARSADFYGPGAHISLLESVLFARLRAGKAPQWVGDPQRVHTFSYTPDIGRALAMLGQDQRALGQTWHLPTAQTLDAATVTGRALTRAACAIAGQPDRLQVAPRWLLHAMGWFVPVLRENREMMYQYEHDYRFDSSKFELAFGLQPTPYRDGLAQTQRFSTESSK
ncbi:nucleoside-diphosphate-sugar epimerase [Hydrogenophaga palleronii]|uniref:Nucleoside-diphosphate-sugar epimerase n=1 Tax=Hydrogenophaga palleronii TaxID=65655 RepID=A0ABU1WK25_9BURK|nr:NAD-dependent epimerase/dehydratase family protein [Hydrogenophaga palleronii]MDR7149606.1 nucleoside-diphosphate-sugar epimerase [Hydrogenophaga palleronii]